MSSIYWLASYPKSGNTWLRAFISNVLNDSQQGSDINALEESCSLATSRLWIDGLLGFKSGLLAHDEIERLMPSIYRFYAQQGSGIHYHKTHLAYTLLPDGQSLIPADVTAGAIYLVRNPLDVAISFAHHRHCSIDETIKVMADSSFALAGEKDRLLLSMRENLGDWSGHVASWLDAEGVGKLVVPYEMMRSDSLATFTRICRFLHLPDDSLTVQRALDGCAFEGLQRQEQQRGFREKAPLHERFFRKGIAGEWQQALTTSQIERIVADHHEMMSRLGYLDESGQPRVIPVQEKVAYE